MIGQGRPQSGPRLRLRWRLLRAGAVLVAAVLALIPCCARASELDLRLRIAWGGGESCAWRGTIKLSAGVLSAATPLGLEADDPGSMQRVDDQTVRVFPRTPRSYDGCDVRVQAPADATLVIELAAGSGQPAAPLEIKLADVVKGVAQFPLGERQNRLLVQRSPGDAIRVAWPKDHLVFAPGEKLTLEAAPNPADLTPSTTYLLAAALTPGRSEEQLWNSDHELKTDAAGVPLAPVTIDVPLPLAEGVYDVRLSLIPKRLTTTLVRGKPLVSRKVQVVVIAPVKPLNRTPAEWQPVLEFDPTSPKWWERMTRLPSSLRLPSLPAQPVGSGKPAAVTHQDRAWVELPAAGWQAYPLTVATPGQPHQLEIEYPSDVEQTLGISLVEPNASGQVGPIGLDSGIDVPPPAAGHKPAVKRFRLTFWPNTREPHVLLTNRSGDRPAIFGKVSLLAGPLELAPLPVPPPRFAVRTLAAYYDKPLFVENFSAPKVVDPVTDRALDDWVTFYEGGRRLVETLQHSGFNALHLSVLCEGSALYPSGLVQPTPKSDTGIFFESGQDPVRKDVLELLFRLCDRAGIQLVPVVQFAAPLPELEAQRLAGDESALGLEPIGPDGRTWLEANGARRGLGVYYNPLDERVQQAMRAVVAELAERYGKHPSFGGISVQLGADSYALLPDETCSYDPATLRAFAEQTATEFPPSATTPGEQADFLRGAGEEAWLAWRVKRLAELYRGLREEVTGQRAAARLYLATGDLLAGRQVQLALRPTLPARSDPRRVLRLMGIDLEQLTAAGLVAPRPQRIVPRPLPTADFQQHWNQAGELDALFTRGGRAVGMHLLEPAPLRLPEFDAVSPFGADQTHSLLVAQIPPAGPAYRQRFVHSLALFDSPTLIDGGWLLPLGQNSELEPLAKAFRRLPAEAFATVKPKGAADRAAGVVVRTLVQGGKTFFYVVNDAPWPAELTLDFQSPAPLRVRPLADERAGETKSAGGQSTWTVNLEPYDLAGGEIDSEAVVLRDYHVQPPSDAPQHLREQIRGIRLRANALRDPSPRQAALSNPSFEAPAAAAAIPGWVQARGPGITVELDAAQGHESKTSLHVVSRGEMGMPAPVVWIRTEPFAPPITGRMSLYAWIKVADATKQPVLRLAVEGKLDGRVRYWKGNVGAPENGQPATPLGTTWAPYRFPVPSLPQTGLTDLRIGFDLMGAGEVWIDEVQVFDLWFEENERNELLKGIATADVHATAGQLADGERFLGGYWPGFLRRHVELSESRLPLGLKPPAVPGKSGGIVAQPATPPANLPPDRNAAAPAEPPAPSMFDRVKGLWPKSWR